MYLFFLENEGGREVATCLFIKRNRELTTEVYREAKKKRKKDTVSELVVTKSYPLVITTKYAATP